MIHQREIILPAYRKGFHLITDIIRNELIDLPEKGLLNVFIKHTSAGISLNENADPDVRKDFEDFLNRFIPESTYFRHISEGLDDMPAHIKSSLIGNSISIPIRNYRLELGIWQGIYLCEFRNNGGKRKLLATILS